MKPPNDFSLATVQAPSPVGTCFGRRFLRAERYLDRLTRRGGAPDRQWLVALEHGMVTEKRWQGDFRTRMAAGKHQLAFCPTSVAAKLLGRAIFWS